MRSNAMKSCAMGAMLFGGTLGAAQQAAAGITWTSSVSWNEPYSYNYETNQWEGNQPMGTNSSLLLWLQAPRNLNGSGTGNIGSDVTASGSAVTGAFSTSINPVWGPLDTYSVSKTATTASGFSVSMEYAAAYGGSRASVNLVQTFEVAAGTTVDVVLTLNAPNMLPPGDYSNYRNVWFDKVVDRSEDFGGYPAGTYQGLQSVFFGYVQPNMSYSQTALTLTEGRYCLHVAYSMGNGSSHTGTLIDFAVVPAPGAAALIGMAGVLAGRRRRN